ncbi:MAG: aminotransferase class I/II-fold pyridoxal phosphate-dependent enzyme [Candidatus Altiarchaeota archaeon]|nr:aminotransferase class I/II-fold pyridoxal phosphate-dependent enzyme [Candidatus Altiarchaeota archaeon]
MKQVHRRRSRFFGASESRIPVVPEFGNMKVSKTLSMLNYVKDMKQKGERIVNFGLGESPFGAPESTKQALADNAHRTSYLPASGLSELRQNITGFYSHYFNYNVQSDQVVVGPGSKELIFLTMMGLDVDWIIPTPSWVSYETQARILGKQFWKSDTQRNGYRISKKGLRNTLSNINSNRPIGILINYPNNPTGLTLDRGEVQKIARFARNNELVILSDEIYANVSHSEGSHHSLALEYPEGTIVTGGVSKDRSMGGWRLGVAIYPDADLANTVKALGSETYSSASSPIQYACIDAYSCSDAVDKHIRDSTSIHSLVGSVVYGELSKAGIELTKPEGAFYTFVSMNNLRHRLFEIGVTSSQDLTETLIHHGVAVIPGDAFGSSPRDLSFRMAYIDYDGSCALEAYRNWDGGKEEFVRTMCPSVWEGVSRIVEFVGSLQ